VIAYQGERGPSTRRRGGEEVADGAFGGVSALFAAPFLRVEVEVRRMKEEKEEDEKEGPRPGRAWEGPLRADQFSAGSGSSLVCGAPKALIVIV
jgi:hypothetical protein